MRFAALLAISVVLTPGICVSQSARKPPQDQVHRLQSHLPAKRELVWSVSGREILTPRFSPDGKFIALVVRGYEPDGADAEGLPDSFFMTQRAKEKANPRFADPVVKVIDLRGSVTCEAKYGWNPSLSSDDERLVFSEQVKPITGFRELASPMSGNAIRLYNCRTRQQIKIADPTTGYLDSPFWSPDDGTIIYTENEAVNGAFGGSVGIAGFDLHQDRAFTLIKKVTVPAVSCPASYKWSALDLKNLTQSFPRIVFQAAPVGTDVLAITGTPIPSPCDLYTARSYDMEMVSVLQGGRTRVPLGLRGDQSDDDISFEPVSGDKVLIFSKYWKLFSTDTGESLPDIEPKNTDPKSVYSPDLRFYLRAEASKAGYDPDHFTLYRTADGKRLQSLRKMAFIYGAEWDSESNRFVIYGVPIAGTNPTHHVEQLVIYSVR